MTSEAGLELIDDIWIHILVYSQLKTFLCVRCVSKRLNDLSHCTNNSNARINQYWHQQCQIICSEIPHFYKCSSWEIFYHQWRSILHLWKKLEIINEHSGMLDEYHKMRKSGFDPKWIFDSDSAIYKLDAHMTFEMLLLMLLNKNKNKNKNKTNVENNNNNNDNSNNNDISWNVSEIKKIIVTQDGKHFSSSMGLHHAPILIATRYGSVKILEYMLSYFSKDNIIDGIIDYNTIGGYEQQDKNQTLLFLSCYFGHLNIVQLLLKYYEKHYKNKNDKIKFDCIINAQDISGMTPIFVAVKHGHTEIVALLYTNGADVNIADKKERTPLWIACCQGYSEIAAFLINTGKIDYKKLSIKREIDGKYKYETVLNYAVKGNRYECVKLLVNTGKFDINQLSGRYGMSPLHVAACYGAGQCVSILIDNGADVNQCTNEEVRREYPSKRFAKGKTPLFFACGNGSYEQWLELKQIRNYQQKTEIELEKKSDDNDIINNIVNIKNQEISVVDILLNNKKVNILQQNVENGMTVMHYAAIGGCFSVIKKVYEKISMEIKDKDKLKAFINIKSKDSGQTALHLACSNEDVPISALEFLIKQCDADLFIKDARGKNAKYHADCRPKESEFVRHSHAYHYICDQMKITS